MAEQTLAQVQGNSIGKSSDAVIRITSANQAAQIVYFIPGVGKATAKALPASVTYSGDFATHADFKDYMEKNELGIVAIRLQTDNVQNFAQKLIIEERMHNDTNNPLQKLSLAKYRESNGADFADTLTIPGSEFGGKLITKPRVSIRLESIQPDSYVEMTLIVQSLDKGSLQVNL